jgi:hypothetical protein
MAEVPHPMRLYLAAHGCKTYLNLNLVRVWTLSELAPHRTMNFHTACVHHWLAVAVPECPAKVVQ